MNKNTKLEERPLVIFILHDQSKIIKVFAKLEPAIAAYNMGKLLSETIKLDSAEIN